MWEGKNCFKPELCDISVNTIGKHEFAGTKGLGNNLHGNENAWFSE